jgi:hypothetical protein
MNPQTNAVTNEMMARVPATRLCHTIHTSSARTPSPAQISAMPRLMNRDPQSPRTYSM